MNRSLDAVRRVADAVLYEGYVLYPYRASAPKNRSRWQFGVLMPPAYLEVDPSERARLRTECVLESTPDSVLHVVVRFLQVQRRTVEGGTDGSWDEAVEREVTVDCGLGGTTQAFHIDGGEDVEPVDGGGRLVRRRRPLTGAVIVETEPLPGPWRAVKLRVQVENRTEPEDRPPNREAALPCALVAAHAMISVMPGAFVSMVDPPEWAAAFVAGCTNEGTWPVLAGSRSTMLSAPIILYDNPELAPESPGDLYDGTEIDEILTLRTMALTDDEKRQARATDPRAAAIIDRTEALDGETLLGLHGTFRTPETPVAEGSRVRLRPGARRADAQDMFLAGRLATVQAVLEDVDDNTYLAVTLDDDPAADLKRSHGRYLYFAPDEVEPVTGWRVFVACVGNIFLGDDGFGVEVAQRLAGDELPEGVKVADIGIRGIHLAYELMDGCDLLVLVDAAVRGEPPGTVAVLEATPPDAEAGPPVLDAHGLAPDELLAMLAKLGARPGRTLVVACEPANVNEGIGLSAPVEAAVPEAVRLVKEIIERRLSCSAD